MVGFNPLITVHLKWQSSKVFRTQYIFNLSVAAYKLSGKEKRGSADSGDFAWLRVLKQSFSCEAYVFLFP